MSYFLAAWIEVITGEFRGRFLQNLGHPVYLCQRLYSRVTHKSAYEVRIYKSTDVQNIYKGYRHVYFFRSNSRL